MLEDLECTIRDDERVQIGEDGGSVMVLIEASESREDDFNEIRDAVRNILKGDGE